MIKATAFCKAGILAAGLLTHTCARAETLTFETFTPGMDHFSLPNGFGGLTWENFQVLNAVNHGFRTGYRNGMISPNNVIFNPFGDPAAIRCSSHFQLISAFMTAAVIDGLEVHVRGLAGGLPLYDETYVLSTESPSYIEFNWEGIDRVEFSSTPGSQFAIDNLDVIVPNSEIEEPTPRRAAGRRHFALPD
jgi:hypothetical protein